VGRPTKKVVLKKTVIPILKKEGISSVKVLENTKDINETTPVISSMC
jgi:hypothetical protein